MTIKVLIVDDSLLMRGMLSNVLGADPEIEVVGTAADPFDAREKIKSLNPDVLTLDVEMPRMDGLEFLRKIMALRPMPVVMVSSLTVSGSDVTVAALEIGAVDVAAKPGQDTQAMADLARDLPEKVKMAAKVKVRGRPSGAQNPGTLAMPTGGAGRDTVIAMGASTGGVETLLQILRRLPDNAPCVMITQHMPPVFTTGFARRLDAACAATVREAQDFAPVRPGHVYVAPGDQHMELARDASGLVCRLRGGGKVSGHKPSVDVLFSSVARVVGAKSVGVILTGMGRDGADGLLAMRRAGAATLGQDEASCLVYGMPRAAKGAGAVEREVSAERMATAMLEAAGAGPRARLAG